jgi:hypothetical protein
MVMYSILNENVQSTVAAGTVRGIEVIPDRQNVPERDKIVPVLARELVSDVLYQFHDAPEAGHMGVRRTKNEIKKRVFWHGMNKDIAEYVKTCSSCQRNKSEKLKAKGLLGDVPEAKAVFEVIFIDFVGPLPRSRNGNRFILVVVDQLSSWVEVFPMPTATAQRVARTLEDQVFCRFGSPKNMVSDNASHFINRTVAKPCKEWSVRHVKVSAYHPAPNKAETTNLELKRMIATYVEGSQGNWDVYMQKFALVLRSKVNETTKVSPAILNLGREIQLPFDRAMQSNSSSVNVQELAQSIPDNLRIIIESVRQDIVKAHEMNKKYFDQSH